MTLTPLLEASIRDLISSWREFDALSRRLQTTENIDEQIEVMRDHTRIHDAITKHSYEVAAAAVASEPLVANPGQNRFPPPLPQDEY